MLSANLKMFENLNGYNYLYFIMLHCILDHIIWNASYSHDLFAILAFI